MASSASSNGDASNVWIYHERQQAALCGQHALNNLSQSPVFTVGQLAEIARQLDEMERSVMEPSAASTPSSNVDEMGNFSIQVLKFAIQDMFRIPLPHLSVALQEVLSAKKDITDFQGFICHKSDHWFAIRQVGGRFWNLNSTLQLPEVVSHFQLATEMERCELEGYTVFAIEKGLPSGGEKEDGFGDGTWYRMSDLLQGKSKSAVQAPMDPWSGLVGKGMRLDGRGGTATANGSSTSSSNGHAGGTGLSHEEEELQRALAMSLEDHQVSQLNEQLASVVVPDEPAAGTPGAVRLQLRLPDGKRLVRRFLQTDSVQAIYALVNQQQQANNDSINSQRLELRYGFPPKDMADLQCLTIGDANLAGESIQGRFI